LVTLLGAAALVAGCGSSGGRPGLSASQALRLHSHLDAAWVAAGSHNRPATLAALSALRSDVGVLTLKGRLNQAQAHTLMVEVQQAEARASTEIPAPAAPATPAAPPVTQPQPAPAPPPAAAPPPAPAAAPPAASTHPAPSAPGPPPPADLPPGLARHGKGKDHGKGGHGDGGDGGD
jgi:hypothetical protein